MQNDRFSESMLNETELIEGCQKGKRASQQRLYDHFCKKMMVLCLRYSKSTAEAEDILQEGFIKVFRGIGGFRKDAKLETWITRIMVNTALNHHRKKLYLFPMVDIETTNLADEGVDLGGLQLSELLVMIQSLPQGCQIIFNMFAIEGLSHREIAENLGISEGTSKSQYARARMLLQEKIKRESLHGKQYGEGKF